MENKVQVGIVENYPVYYIPEKDIIFCKNTAVKYDLLKRLYDNPFTHNRIEEKSLDIVKDEFLVRFGCLNTDKENCQKIIKIIKKLKK